MLKGIIMILFILLTIVIITALAIALILVGTLGGVFLFVFGDVIVCIAIIVLIIKFIRSRRS